MVKVFLKASIYPYNLHMPRPMFFSIGMDIHHSKSVMPREFGVSRSKIKVTVTFNTEIVFVLKLLIAKAYDPETCLGNGHDLHLTHTGHEIIRSRSLTFNGKKIFLQ